jgi:hypothetical protein
MLGKQGLSFALLSIGIRFDEVGVWAGGVENPLNLVTSQTEGYR